MLSKLLGKNDKDSDESEIIQKISKMDLNDMRIFVNNKLTDFKICEDGLFEVMKRLNSENDKSKRFIEDDSMDTKIKKAFDLVILVGASKKITISTVELIREFTDIYAEMIHKFDTDNKQTYGSKLKKTIDNALVAVAGISEFKKKQNFLGN